MAEESWENKILIFWNKQQSTSSRTVYRLAPVKWMMSRVSIVMKNIAENKLYTVLFYILLAGALISYFLLETGIGLAICWLFLFIHNILSYIVDKQDQSPVVYENKRDEAIDRIIKLALFLKLAAIAYLVYHFLFVKPIGGYAFMFCILFVCVYGRLINWLEKKKIKDIS